MALRKGHINIKAYNAALPSKEILERYLNAYRIYLRIKENGIPITFFVNNLGTAKATDVSVTIEFPDQVHILNTDDAIAMDEPTAPEKGKDPIQKAYAQVQHERAFALDMPLSNIGGFGSLPDISAIVASPFAFCGPQRSAMHFPAVAVRDKTVAENHPTWDSH